jgi:DNA invertase Pin-like site-specific DNA recombinase
MSAQSCELSGATDLPAQICFNAGDPEPNRRAEHLIRVPLDDLLPRPERRRKRAKTDRGLPPDEELAKLAKAYLERQRKHWPQIVEAGLLPDATDNVIRQMVEDFKQRHRTGKVDVEAVRPFLRFGQKLAGSYNRFSCDNSSPTSALDQMVNALDKARGEARFVPWQYVFCDYAVTGLDAGRQGYMSYKAVLAEKDQLIETNYIDDFTRASRDELEWWKLAALSKRLSKRMIGSSDGFDLSSPDWDLKITIYGLLSRLFIKSLREKVRRGMRGAARRGTNLGKLPLGFTRRAHRDEHGREVLDRDGLPIYEPCIDPATQEFRLLMFELFTQKSWSAFKIMKHFNQLKVDGWDGWSESAIKKLLWSATAIGVFIWNKHRREYNWEEEKMELIRNPRSEWEVRYDRNLAIVPMEWFRAARRKLAAMRRASPLTGRKPSRNQVSATTLFSGTLFCEHCEEEVKLIRSTSKYKQMGCWNGITGSYGCKLSSSKSTRVVEECLLGYLRDVILTDSQVEALVAKANAEQEREAQKPQVNTTPWKAEIRKLEAKIKKLMALVEDEPDKDLCIAHNNRIKQLQKEVNSLAEKVREAEGKKRKAAKPLSIKKVKSYLASFRETLNQEIPAAAEAIRALTGPIKIRQEPAPGRKQGNRWIATFSPDLFGVLRYMAQSKGDSAALRADGDGQPATIEVPLEKIPKYELLAPLFKQLHDNGASVLSIAASHGMSWQYADEIIRFANTGERPQWKSGKKGGTGGKPRRYIEISSEVVALRDKKKLTFARIAEDLKVGESTVRRAYDHGRPEVARRAAESGGRLDRGRRSHIDDDKLKEIRKLIRTGKNNNQIAEKVGCGASSVRRVRLAMKAEGEAA